MTNDEFFSSLQNDWRRNAIPSEDIARSYIRHQRWRRTTVIGSIAGAAAIFAGFAGLTAMAVVRHHILNVIAALTFALAVPLAILDVLRMLRQLRIEYERTPLGVLRQSRVRLDALQIMLKSTRACALLLALAAVAAGTAAVLGYAKGDIALGLSLLWGSTAIGLWLWQTRRGLRLADERTRIETLLHEFEGDKA